MVQGNGNSVCKGIAIGKIYLYRKQEFSLPKKWGTYEEEKACFMEGKKQAYDELECLLHKMKKEYTKEEIGILEVQQMMLEDLDFLQKVEHFLKMGKSAPEAVFFAGEELGTFLDCMEDEYIKGRSADVRDATRRILCNLVGSPQVFSMKDKGIVIANDLTPTDMVSLPREKVLGIITQKGSKNSHGAILARTMNIPVLIQANIGLEDDLEGKELALDTLDNTFYIEPADYILRTMKKKQKQFTKQEQAYLQYKSMPSITPKGQKIYLYANIGSMSELEDAKELGVEGIGLVRSEFLYMGRETKPSENELFQCYTEMAKNMCGKLVVIRTLDIGADKNVSYIRVGKEENPALGYRGIRMSLEEKHLFYTQLRAVYRASAYGRVGILLPMIISLDEVIQAKEMIAYVKNTLKSEGIPYGEVPLGIMIETPAAVLISASLAKEVDFFSVGTNDLTQYTLAADRQNQRLEPFYDHCHPAILTQLEMILLEGRKAGIPVGICGEVAEDTVLTHKLIEMGYKTLSVSTNQVLKVRKTICEGE